jgi:hypothetical protein
MANGTLAASQIEMLSQSGTGIMTIVPPATNTNRTLTLPDSAGTIATVGTSLTLATAVTASGTSVDFTGIPSWVKRVTVMFSGVSTNGINIIVIKLGTAAGVESSGYVVSRAMINGSNTSDGLSSATTDYFIAGTGVSSAAADTSRGALTISKVTGNTWVATGIFFINGTTLRMIYTAGDKTLAGDLTQVRVTTEAGLNTFDAGTINIMYEG